MLWLNDKHIEERFGHKNLQETTITYHLDHKKHKFEIVDEPSKPNQQFFYRQKINYQSNYEL